MEGGRGSWLAGDRERSRAVMGIEIKAALDAHVARLEDDS